MPPLANKPMTKQSAGLLMYRNAGSAMEVLLVHPGGPFWKKKDLGAWSIPKGEYTDEEDPLAAAQREFEEETGIRPQGPFLPLGQIRQAGGKVVAAWAFAGDCDAAAIQSNTFTMEWPRGSGRVLEFPEVDRAEWFSLEMARQKILPSQATLLEKLTVALG